MTFSRMTPQGSQWEAVWPGGPVWNPDTWQKPQGKQPASTVVLGDNQESAQRCLPKTFYYSPTQNILGRNAVTNLDSILKSSDLTLLTKARLVKATVFPVVMYECESWTIKKAECRRIDAFELWCWRVESPLDCKENKPVHPKRNRSWKFVGRTDAKAETPILWPPDAKNWLIGKDPDAGKDWGQEEKGMTEDEMVGWHHQLYGHEFEQASWIDDGQESLACYSPWGSKESDTIEQLKWTELNRNKDECWRIDVFELWC